ncbi:MAG: hypothetical protein K0Q55_3072 [Verrucomicrobia bacterium]|jgi:hypothetical protein|nr:hypothetical protein [Verrucomicrobiota bacterium]
MIAPVMFKMLLPLACTWAEEQETMILRDGVPLTAKLLADARAIGVKQPERVRLRVVEEVPMPTNPLLKSAAEETGLLSPLTAGLTLRYGIFIRADCWGDRRLVAHELVHTMQYERMGGFAPFLEQYLQECLTLGYPNGELEQEARRVEKNYE